MAAGDGNFALACAREGASVVARTSRRAMVERGGARTAAEGYDVEWVEADAEELPFEDARFECVGSVFGAMIAPRPECRRRGAVPGRAARRHRGHDRLDARQLLRRALRARARATRRRPPDQPPSRGVGREEIVRERFDGLAARIEIERRTLRLGGRVARGDRRPRWRRTPRRGGGSRGAPGRAFEAMRARVARAVARCGGGDGPVRSRPSTC